MTIAYLKKQTKNMPIEQNMPDFYLWCIYKQNSLMNDKLQKVFILCCKLVVQI